MSLSCNEKTPVTNKVTGVFFYAVVSRSSARYNVCRDTLKDLATAATSPHHLQAGEPDTLARR